MPSVGAPELIVVLVLALFVFGAGKLPEVGSALGKGIREFRAAVEGESSKKPKEDQPTRNE
ncbi:MAG TPA: twin-arginine translocase TatA/TatE family subunit [Chloroflexota bacterium]|nr:twin-arginine translocase TatA/TatE family subunit [Chloroflexota bacterium]